MTGCDKNGDTLSDSQTMEPSESEEYFVDERDLVWEIIADRYVVNKTIG